ncbi:hypothetical protein [Geminocystis sp. NIES-3709]|uniref:hypothetical protein n=1 Tax=Geminocystis sp. NIES-3709 TaxID=1617448 RepID=UPI0005FC74B0|nr:hypothetical protein [Geminocystis sp. NIES-3709]BAQ63451.1 hypothetical protein GM3709_216 [Geminocystis sp. NIES-3709]
MDNWQNKLFEWLNNAQQELESFSAQINQDLQKNTEDWEKTFNEITEEVEDIFTSEFNQILIDVDHLMGNFLSFFFDEEYLQQHDRNLDIDEDLGFLFEDYKLKPHPEKHPACVGCVNYHGQTYNGNLLVCAMHPYGWDDETCPDWKE